MKYTPRLPTGNVNVSDTHPLKEFALLVSGILGVLAVVYVLLGFTLELVIIPRMSADLERSLGELFVSSHDLEQAPEEDYVQAVLGRLVRHLPRKDLEFRVSVEDSLTVNAMALPGGRIVLFKGLLEKVESENELAMVLGHELGHFANRDHLKGLGRGLVLLVLSTVVLGQDSEATQFLMDNLSHVEARFSQRQEREADTFGLHLLQDTYGHVAGATDFFLRGQKEDDRDQWAYFFASHPSPADRVESLEEQILTSGYTRGDKSPLSLEYEDLTPSPPTSSPYTTP